MSDTTKNQKKASGTGGHASGNTAGHAGRPRKNTKSAPKKESKGSGEFRIGSRDILESPEIMSPFDPEEPVAPEARNRS